MCMDMHTNAEYGEQWSQGSGHIHLPLFRNLGNFVSLTFPVTFGRDTKRWWPFCLVSLPGEVKDPTQGINA